MKKLLAVTVIALFAASTGAMAGEGLKARAGGGYDCGYGKVAETKAPITVALKSGPITVKPATRKAPKTGG